MDLRIVIPARAPELGKSRLAAVLTPAQRTALGLRLFDHVLGIAVATAGSAAVLVVSRSDDLLARATAAGAQTLREAGDGGLNAALEQAAAVLAEAGDGPVLSLSVDLPLLEAADLAAIMAAPGDVVCATDIPGEGTNALLLRRPRLIPYRYGPGSRAAHAAEAAARGLAISVVSRAGLAQDVDLPADLVVVPPHWLAAPA